MLADPVGGGDPVGEEIGDGRRVKPLDVIGFEEGVDHQFPVGGDMVRAALVEVVGADPERIEILAQHFDLGEILIGIA